MTAFGTCLPLAVVDATAAFQAVGDATSGIMEQSTFGSTLGREFINQWPQNKRIII
jgi:hypothetical protein